ncbi:MAG: AMP-binding protein [Acidimicrobiales bacterium]
MNLATIVEPHPAADVALRHGGVDVTYGELRSRVAATRQVLHTEVEPGHVVALILPATPDFVVAYLAVLGLGAVAAPLNPESPISELERELATIRANVVMVGSPTRSLVEALGYPVRDCAQSEAASVTSATPSAQPVAVPVAVPIAERGADDLAVLLFTSGTAGSPKAAMLTHGSLLANIDQMELAVGLAATRDDTGLLVVPPFHIYGLNAVLGLHLFAGGRLVMMERFVAADLLEIVEKERVTILPGVPQLFAALLAHGGASGSELSSLRLACSGAAPLPLEVSEAFEAKFGVQIWQAYGLTEASPTVTFPDLDADRHPLSAGAPLPGIELTIVDPDGDPVEHGDPGEVLVRGPNVFSGYFEDPTATKLAIDAAGWLHTGDVAVMDDAGSITIVDRNKDLIIVSGFNVFPAEVEHVLEESPAVDEAAVVGVPDSLLGESVRAFVVPKTEAWPDGANAPGGVSESELIEHCALRLARYKCPSSVVFVRELPHGIQGKALRRALA